MKKTLLVLAGLLVLGAVLFASLRAGGRDQGVKVYAAPAERRDIARIVRASGQVDPRVKVNISAHVIGKIEELFVEEGQRIEAGSPFLKLEQEAYLANRDRARAELEISRSRLRQAEIDLEDARLRLKRIERLAGEKIVSPEQLESAHLAERSAALSLEQAREAVAQATATLEKAQDDLVKTTIYAPLSGTVIALNAEEGEVVVSGTMNNPASVIGTIADLSEILAEVDVDETEIVYVRPGQEAVLQVDAIPDREYQGRVVEIGSSGFERPQQPDVTFFKVKILFQDPDDALRPGMSVRAEICTALHEEALAVPIQAVVQRAPAVEEPPAGSGGEPGEGQDGEEPVAREEEVKVVFVAEEGQARQRPVETGLSDATHVEIVSGLAAGEIVVTGPYRSLRDLDHAEAIRVTEEEGEDGEEGEERDED